MFSEASDVVKIRAKEIHKDQDTWSCRIHYGSQDCHHLCGPRDYEPRKELSRTLCKYPQRYEPHYYIEFHIEAQ